MNNSFEDHARDQFDRHEVPVDVEALWAEVYPKVKEEDKNRKFFWFFLTGFLLASVLFAVFYFLPKVNNNLLTPKETSHTETLEHKEVTPRADVNTTSTNTSESGTTRQEGSISDPANQETNLKSSPTINNNVIVEKQHAGTATLNIQNMDSPGINTKMKKNKVIILAEKEISKPQDNESTTADSVTEPSSANALGKVADSDDSGQFVADENNETTKQLLQDQEQLADILLFEDSTQVTEKEDMAPEALAATANEQSTELENKEVEADEDGLTNNALTKGMRYGFGIYGGVSGSAVVLTAEREDAGEYLALRKASEEELETIHLGINFILHSKQNIYLRTGAEYTRMARLYSTESSSETRDSIDGIVEIRINNITGDTTEVAGKLVATTTETYIKKSYNYIHLLDVPIIFGYNFGDDHWQIGMEAGIFANVLLKRKGDIFDSDLQNHYNTGTDDQQWYKTNVGITPYIGINGMYNISDNFQIHVTPGFRFKKLFTTNNSLLKEERANLGMWIGIRYFL